MSKIYKTLRNDSWDTEEIYPNIEPEHNIPDGSIDGKKIKDGSIDADKLKEGVLPKYRLVTKEVVFSQGTENLKTFVSEDFDDIPEGSFYAIHAISETLHSQINVLGIWKNEFSSSNVLYTIDPSGENEVIALWLVVPDLTEKAINVRGYNIFSNEYVGNQIVELLCSLITSFKLYYQVLEEVSDEDE